MYSFLRLMVNPVDAVLFQPPKPTYSFGVRGTLVPEMSLVQIDSLNGYCVVATPVTDETTCILWVHGNACDCGEESSGYLSIARALHVAVIAVEFPGYGACGGIASEPAVDAATASAYEYAKSKHFDRIIIAGRSVGSGPATRLARRLCENSAIEFAGLILWSPIVSVKEQCANIAGQAISSFLGDRWAPIKDTAFVSRPILFIVGEKDSLTTPLMCNRVRNASMSAPYTFFHTSETADHNNGWDFQIDVIQPIERFLAFISTQTTFTLDDEESPESDDESDLALKGDHVLGGNLGEISSVSTVEEEAKQSSQQVRERNHDKAEIVVIGCGPVGLWTTCNLLHLGVRGEKIVCVDKYETFQRSHVLRLESASVAQAPESLQELIKPELGVTRTNAIESKLAKECTSKGVQFIRPLEVTSDIRSSIKSIAPMARAVICCDGSHSVCRKNLFGGLERRFTVEFVLDCRGEVQSENKPGKLSFAAMVDMMGKITTWPVTFRVLITGTEMHAIRSTGKGTARNPLEFDGPDTQLMPDKVHRSIETWLETRKRTFHSEAITNLRCVAVDLNCYRAHRFVALDYANEPTIPYFLVGDAAFGVPFFRALNNGLMCGTQCARSVIDELYNNAGTNSLFDRKAFRASTGVDEDELALESAPVEHRHFLARSMGASMASVSLSSQVSQILAHASFEPGLGMLTESSDPLRRYDDFVRRLARKEFAIAQSKRDGLEITKFANYVQRNARVMSTSLSTISSV